MNVDTRICVFFQMPHMDVGRTENAYEQDCISWTTHPCNDAISALPLSVVVVLGQRICPWMDGSRATHMYRTYGSRAMQEQLPRSSCRGAAKRCAEEQLQRINFSACTF